MTGLRGKKSRLRATSSSVLTLTNPNIWGLGSDRGFQIITMAGETTDTPFWNLAIVAGRLRYHYRC